MKLKWHNTDEVIAAQLADQVIEDLARLDVEHPSALVFHHVFLSGDYKGPLVFVWGVENDDHYHCEYDAKPVWKTGAELDAERNASTSSTNNAKLDREE